MLRPLVRLSCTPIACLSLAQDETLIDQEEPEEKSNGHGDVRPPDDFDINSMSERMVCYVKAMHAVGCPHAVHSLARCSVPAHLGLPLLDP